MSAHTALERGGHRSLRLLALGVLLLTVTMPAGRSHASVRPTSASTASNPDDDSAIESVIGDIFSYSMSLSGDTLAVGAPYDDTPDGTNAGSVYIFVRSGNAWALQATLLSPSPNTDDIFGRSVDLDGDTLIVGDPLDDRPEGPDAGSAFVYVRTGTDWSLQATLSHPDPAAGDIFGRWAAISGDTAVVAAPFDDTTAGTDAGSVFVFVRSGTTWSLQQELSSPMAAAGNRFGKAIDIDGDTIIVGEPRLAGPTGQPWAGGAYVFVRSGSTWSLQATLRHPYPNASDHFGRWVSLDGDTTVVSAPNDDTGAGANSGSAFVFVRTGTDWSLQATLMPHGSAAGDRFGLRQTLQGDTVAIGSPYDNTSAGTSAGSARVFVRSGTTWTLQSVLYSPTPAAGDLFGRGFGLDGSTLVVAEPYDDNAAGRNGGAAHTYLLAGNTWNFSDTVINPDTTPP